VKEKKITMITLVTASEEVIDPKLKSKIIVIFLIIFQLFLSFFNKEKEEILFGISRDTLNCNLI